MNGNWIGTIFNPISAEDLGLLGFPCFMDIDALPASPPIAFSFAAWCQGWIKISAICPSPKLYFNRRCLDDFGILKKIFPRRVSPGNT